MFALCPNMPHSLQRILFIFLTSRSGSYLSCTFVENHYPLGILSCPSRMCQAWHGSTIPSSHHWSLKVDDCVPTHGCWCTTHHHLTSTNRVLFELYSHPDAEPCMVLGHKNYILMFPRDQPWTVEEEKKITRINSTSYRAKASQVTHSLESSFPIGLLNPKTDLPWV